MGSSSEQNEAETEVESARIVVESSENEEQSVDGEDDSSTTLSDEFTAELLAEHPFDCLNQELDVFVNVFGIYVISHSSIPRKYIEHSANVVAEFMDNDADGVVDDPEVHRFLVDNNFVVPVWTEELRERIFPSLSGSFCEDNLG
ncbi:MAG TPA: hypothetical protein DEB38_02735, partial [Acidimicrobiaceae bacterium]|nr:hypothetical protein [Acidimicrobiaceae bacterium]